MARENSFSDSIGRSLTPDMEDEGASPISTNPRNHVFPVRVAEPSPQRSQSTNPRSSSEHSSTFKINIPPIQSPTIQSPTIHRPHAWPKPKTPLDKFRSVVRKVMVLHRGTSFLTDSVGRIGAEPGVNPRRASANLLYGHIRQDCVIEVIDYSSVRSSFGRMTNAEFISLLENPKASEREPWAKVRWINIGGLSWDVIKAVSIKYDLHPLALEDVFHAQSQTRSKADYYAKHLFLRVLCHELGSSDEPGVSSANDSVLADFPRSAYTSELARSSNVNKDPFREMEEEEIIDDNGAHLGRARKRRRFLPTGLLPDGHHDLEVEGGIHGGRESHSSLSRLVTGTALKHQKRAEHEVTLEALKEGERVKVQVSPMFIFLLRDGTVISIHSVPNLQFTSPISKRLHQRDTGLRTSADPSLLVHAILDLIVDNALEVIDEYHTKINKFERTMLLRAKMKTVRYLHILSGDLILHKRTMEPIRTLIYGLRRYDLDRCAALVDMSDPDNANTKIVGFMSHKSKIYLADVHDHMEYILTSLDMFAGIAENLIAYSFNMASYEMNIVMRRLTLATIIFLPLTLLTGYFGMNFDPMWSVNQHSDVFFWKIALPVMAVIIPLFTYSDIKAAWHYMQKRMTAKKAAKAIKQA